ncbi:MAG: DUF262 domain-containing protein, partial [Chloroflexi bacterium]|nr:DUF262 domain-containing protein [Chloroflexota bacterium]
MYQQGGTISDALDSIASNDYVLPAIQREFVWRPEQICRLFDSVMQGYPFGEFLFWRIDRGNSHEYRWYGFVRDYHQRNNPRCPDLGVLHDKALTAVLDGQQRLTAFNIGLRGSMALKRPYKRWNNPSSFPRRVLALDLLASSDPDERGNRYTFEFIDEHRIGLQDSRLWFRVSDIRTLKTGPDMFRWLMSHEVTAGQLTVAFDTLDRLHSAVSKDQTVVYYEETEQDIDRVLNIFIRRNSGGTVLSYSDLLLSIATSQWTELDARKEVHQLVDELNDMRGGFDLSKDIVLKAGLMLTDISSVGFKVENFTHANMSVLEDNWPRIRDALIATVELVASFGFDRKTIRAQSALMPIAYYFYRWGSPSGFITRDSYAADRKAIRGWLTRSILKASGIWGSGLDTLLTALREVLRKADSRRFPAEEMRRVMALRGKSLDFSPEEVEDLADIRYGDSRLYALLTLLFPFIDPRNRFHIDHVFPASRFTRARLTKVEISEDRIEDFRDCAHRLGNLQLLDGDINKEKRAKLPVEWLAEHFRDPQTREHYREQHCL